MAATSGDDVAPAAVRFERSDNFQSLNIEYKNGAEVENYSILESLGGGVGIFDFDRDGKLDIIFPGGGYWKEDSILGRPTRLIQQFSSRSFQDVSNPSRISSPRHYTHGVACGDFNNDGFCDVLITGYGGVQLWCNCGDGTFEDQTEAAGLADDSWSTSAAWGDFNGDGAADLYVAHYVNWSPDNDPVCRTPDGTRDVCPPRQFEGLDDVMFLSQGDGRFTKHAGNIGLKPAGKGLGVIAADLDGDHDLDLYVANDTVPNFLYVNDGTGHFQEEGLLAGLAVDEMANPNGSMGISLADFNQDGTPDLCVTNYEEELTALYRNDGKMNFLYQSRQQGLSALSTQFVGFGCVAGDFDLDGDPDVVISNGHVVYFPANSSVRQLPLLLLNQTMEFIRVDFPSKSYFGESHLGRGLAVGDVDRDGILDLAFANMNEPSELLFGTQDSDKRAIILKLVGRSGSRDAIGARVVVKKSDQQTSHFISSGMGYLSSSPLEITVPISEDSPIQAIEISWPGGGVTTVSSEAVHSHVRLQDQRVLTIVEPAR